MFIPIPTRSQKNTQKGRIAVVIGTDTSIIQRINESEININSNIINTGTKTVMHEMGIVIVVTQVSLCGLLTRYSEKPMHHFIHLP